uniref:Predicted protein n=1 Tax=Hordeum vulgare subsp. vulgare TaxID=112509 RepID=F2D427_HORVV|nr:predicted protein [Hordeum vulgare subsp. vulgare]
MSPASTFQPRWMCGTVAELVEACPCTPLAATGEPTVVAGLLLAPWLDGGLARAAGLHVMRACAAANHNGRHAREQHRPWRRRKED